MKKQSLQQMMNESFQQVNEAQYSKHEQVLIDYIIELFDDMFPDGKISDRKANKAKFLSSSKVINAEEFDGVSKKQLSKLIDDMFADADAVLSMKNESFKHAEEYAFKEARSFDEFKKLKPEDTQHLLIDDKTNKIIAAYAAYNIPYNAKYDKNRDHKSDFRIISKDTAKKPQPYLSQKPVDYDDKHSWVNESINESTRDWGTGEFSDDNPIIMGVIALASKSKKLALQMFDALKKSKIITTEEINKVDTFINENRINEAKTEVDPKKLVDKKGKDYNKKTGTIVAAEFAKDWKKLKQYDTAGWMTEDAMNFGLGFDKNKDILVAFKYDDSDETEVYTYSNGSVVTESILRDSITLDESINIENSLKPEIKNIEKLYDELIDKHDKLFPADYDTSKRKYLETYDALSKVLHIDPSISLEEALSTYIDGQLKGIVYQLEKIKRVLK